MTSLKFLQIPIQQFLETISIPFSGANAYVKSDGTKDGDVLRPNKPKEEVLKDLSKIDASHITAYLKYYTDNKFLCLDIDDKTKTNDEIHNIVKDKLGYLPPFTLSATKLKPHYFIFVNNFDLPNFKRKNGTYFGLDGDLLADYVVEKNHTPVYYTNDVFSIENHALGHSVRDDIEMLDLDWSTVKHHFSQLYSKEKNPIQKTKLSKSQHTNNNEPNHYSNTPIVVDDKISLQPKPIVIDLFGVLETSHFEDYQNWIDLLMTSKNLGISYDLFDTFCSKCKNYNNSGNITRWLSYNPCDTKNNFGIPKLIQFAKMSNILKTSEILQKYDFNNSDKLIDRLIDEPNNDNMAILLLSLLDNRLKFNPIKKIFLLFNTDNCLWEPLENGDVICKKLLNDFIPFTLRESLQPLPKLLKALKKQDELLDEPQNKSKIDALEYKINTLKKLLIKCGQDSFKAGTVNSLRSLSYEKQSFFELFDKKPNLFAFSNGICIDLYTNEKRKLLKEDYLSISTGYEYKDVSQEQIKLTRDLIYTYFEDEDTMNSYLSALSCALLGNNKNENMFIFTGTGRNGKSCMSDLIKNVFGNYYYPLDVSQLTTYSKGADAINSEKANLENKRFVIAEEPESGKKSNALVTATIKEWTGNTDLMVRTLNTKAYKIKPQFTLYLNCNDIPCLTKKDPAISLRLKTIHFPFQFTAKTQDEIDETTRLQNLNIKKDIQHEDYKYGLLGLLLDIYKKNNGVYYESIKVKEATANYLDEQNVVKKWFLEKYELDPKGKLTSTELYKHYCNCNKELHISQNNFGIEMKEFCKTRVYQGLNVYCAKPKSKDIDPCLIEKDI
jgi:P4 family phage/plasmid primase-like protien